MKEKWFFGSPLVVLGVLYLVAPEMLAARSFLLAVDPVANFWLILALGVALIGTGFAAFSEPDGVAPDSREGVLICAALVPVVFLVLLSQHLRDWWIDDAGITFAYSRSLAEGLGLVAQPWLAPEEGYSSSVWMLLLSATALLGLDIPTAAKSLGIGISAVSILLCAMILIRETRSPLAVMLCGIATACAPTVVWAVSGQEHALQSLLLLLVVVCVWGTERWHLPVALVLCVLVLTRPEGPIIVIAVFIAAVIMGLRNERGTVNTANVAVAILPFLTFLALMGFRHFYFGDLFPNPYYAKSSGTGLTGVLNLLGGGWAYLVAGLRDTALLFVLALTVLIGVRRLPDWIIISFAVLAGHVIFVIWAKGDWMGQYRFLMPILPVALLVAAMGLQELATRGQRVLFATLAILVVIHTTALQLSSFKANPTTPFAAVTQVGDTFRSLSDRLGIDDPVLAHHDAGGIAYHRMVRLVDLGGLIDRTIARNMADADFLSAYLLEDKQPDFIFGARNFAAASGFAETEAFAAAYVPLRFTDMPFMRSDLSFVRRDRVTAAPGVEVRRDAGGQLVEVRVDLLAE